MFQSLPDVHVTFWGRQWHIKIEFFIFYQVESVINPTGKR